MPLGGLPSAVQGRREVDAGEDAEVFGFVVVPIFEQPLGVILGSLDHLSAVLVGEFPRLFEGVAFVHGVHPVEGGSSDYEVGGGGHGVLLGVFLTPFPAVACFPAPKGLRLAELGTCGERSPGEADGTLGRGPCSRPSPVFVRLFLHL